MPTQVKRHIPDGYTLSKQAGEAVVYTSHKPGVPHPYLALGWRSNRQIKKDFHHCFRIEADRDHWVSCWFDRQRQVVESKNRRQGVGVENPFVGGEVLVYTWGYEQTNAEFWQVTEVKGKSVVLSRIARKTVDNDAQGIGIPGQSMAAYVVPVKDNFLDGSDPITKRVSFCDDGKGVLKPYVKFDHGHGRLWDGGKQYVSWYG